MKAGGATATIFRVVLGGVNGASQRACLGLLVVCAFGAGLARPSMAHANDFGFDYLVQGPCCDGAALGGTRASISTPGSNLEPLSTNCALIRDIAQGSWDPDGSDRRLIHIGYVRCGIDDYGGGLDGTCSTESNLDYFVEVVWGDGYHCTNLGFAALDETHHYSLWDSGTGNTFDAYFDGAQVTFGNGYDYANLVYNRLVGVGGEITGCGQYGDLGKHGSGNCGSEYVSGAYDLYPPGPETALAWQRYNPSTAAWVDVSVAEDTCDGDPMDKDAYCASGGWLLAGPPDSFVIQYDH